MTPRVRTALGALGAVAVCAYLLFLRVHDLDESFAMLGEQIRDWEAVQGSVHDLPLAGPRSLNSGIAIGPAYYAFLWASRVALAPAIGVFPHSGGWAISLLQTAADLALLIALWRRLDSWPAATAIVLVAGSAPLDVGLTAAIWNPPLAVACTKLAMACLFWKQPASSMTSAGAVAFAWLAVQMHASAIIIALPITVWAVYAAANDVWRLAGIIGVLTVSVALVCLPYLVEPVGRTSPLGASVAAVAGDPLGHLRIGPSVIAILRALDAILSPPFRAGWLGWMIPVGAILVVIARPRSPLALGSAGVLLAAVAICSVWQGALGQDYWFLVLAPAAGIALVAPIAITIAAPLRHWMAGALLAAIVAVQPARAEVAWTRYRLPAYGPLWRGAAAASQGPPIRRLTAAFDVPAGMDPAFLFTLAGGRFEPDTALIAEIRPDGTVIHRLVDER